MPSAPQYTLDLPVSPRYALEEFVVAPSNAVAFQLVTHPESWPEPVAVMVGEAGVGKTHLAHILAMHADARFITAEMLGHAPADALAEGAGLLILDGLETVAERGEGAEAALAQLINYIRAQGRPALLLTAQQAPARIAWALPDVASRVSAAWQTRIAAPEDAVLLAMLRKAFTDRQLRISEEVIAYLARRIERSGHAVQWVVARLDRAALAQGKAVTLGLVREVLAS